MIRRGIYKHFKGKEYKVLFTAKDANSLEDIVVYKALYDDPKYGKNAVWVRPLKEFSDEIDRDGYKGPRFVYVKEK